MSHDLIPFTYQDREIRFTKEGGIIAADLARILGYRDAEKLTRTLDEDEKGTQMVGTPGGEQRMSVVTEAGFYRACLNRQSGYIKDPEAQAFVKAFQRWVTHEVLPAIRRTGTYATRPQPQLSEDEIVHQALQITARRVEQLEADLAKALPKANTWDALCSGRGAHSITDAVAHKISLFEDCKSIRQVRNCDLALIVSITLDYAVEALRLAREETTA